MYPLSALATCFLWTSIPFSSAFQAALIVEIRTRVTVRSTVVDRKMLDVVSTLNIIPHFTGHAFLFARSGFWCSHEHFCFTNCFSFGLFNQWWVPHNSCERVKTACWWHIFLSLIWQMHLTLWSQFGGRYQQSCLSKTFICIYFLNVQYVHVSMCSLVHITAVVWDLLHVWLYNNFYQMFLPTADFQRRERVLEDLAQFKGALVVLFFCHRDWIQASGTAIWFTCD